MTEGGFSYDRTDKKGGCRGCDRVQHAARRGVRTSAADPDGLVVHGVFGYMRAGD